MQSDNDHHIINRVLFDIHLANRSASGKVNITEQLITEVIEELIAESTDQESRYDCRVDRLEITCELSRFDLADLKTALKSQIRKALSDSSSERVAQDRGAEPAEMLEVLLTFLKTGRYPWFATDQAISIENVLSGHGSRILSALRKEPAALKRFIAQFSAEGMWAILKLTRHEHYETSVRSFEELLTTLISSYSTRWGASFKLNQSFRTLLASHLITGDKTDVAFKSTLGVIWPDLMSSSAARGLEAQTLRKINDAVSDTYGSEEFRLVDTATISGRSDYEELTAELSSPESESLQVSNAGLVLLHPFIASFFTKVGLIENGNFTNADCRERGACLLHFLATGSTRFDEHDMSLPKFLCDILSKQPIPIDLPISSFEIHEVGNLLQSVIGHWTALKNTSVEGLRVNFLQRAGILKRDDIGFTLFIEKETMDILIEKLPWPLSFIKLPWQPHLTTIKWI